MQRRVFAGPEDAGHTPRERTLLTCVDELLATRTLSDRNWTELARHLDRRQLIEFVTLVGQYDALAMSLATQGVPLDYPDE